MAGAFQHSRAKIDTTEELDATLKPVEPEI